MAKQKKPKTTSSSVRRAHGPKRKQFKECGKVMSIEFAKCNVLNKFVDESSWRMACLARGCKKVSHDDWKKFCDLGTRQKKQQFFESLGR
jgi:hypothetical protein